VKVAVWADMWTEGHVNIEGRGWLHRHTISYSLLCDET
jgi:hypothetical protein